METLLSTRWIRNSSNQHSSNSNVDKSYKERTKALLKKDKMEGPNSMQHLLSEIKSTLLIIIKVNKSSAKQVSNQMGLTTLNQPSKNIRTTKMRDNMTHFLI